MPLSTRRIPLEVQIPDDHPELLNGLDVWLKLGLISDRQVRRWASQYLVSKVPDYIDSTVSQQDLAQVSQTAPQTVGQTISTPTRRVRDFASESDRLPTKASEPNLVTRILSGFMAELGVMWLLFLGVFLVVVSSAVLASLQWKNFSPVGQYGILWLYTLAFGGAALWTGKHDNLRRTSQMLQAATLLIVPVNFWMMDGFRLGRSVGGAGLCVVAGLVLLGMQALLFRSTRSDNNRSAMPKLLQANYAALSVLHWGWMFPVVPIAAVYAGTIGTAFVQWRSQTAGSNQTANQSANQTANQSANSSNQFGLVIAIAGVALLMVRSVLVARVPLADLGLAFAVSGAVLCWERRSEQLSALVGGALLALAWVVSFDAPWSALAVNLVILTMLWRRLQALWEPLVVAGLVFVGVQTYWLMQVVLSESVRSSILTTAMRMTSVGQDWELSGLPFLVPVVATIALGTYLRRSPKPKLASIAFSLAGVMVVAFALPGLFNPAVRSIYFLISFAILLLGNLAWKRSNVNQDYPKSLVTFTQITAIVGFASLIGWKFPVVWSGAMNWPIVWVVGALLEWALCLGLRDRVWKKSAWQAGIGLALMAWCCLMFSIYVSSVKSPIGLSVRESMIWWVVPIVLTLGARVNARSPQTMPVTASGISIASAVAVVAAVPLLDWNAGSITFSVAIAFVLMVLNTRVIRTAASAAMTIGVLLTLFQLMITRSAFAAAPWFGMMILALWVVHTGLKGRIAAQKSATGTVSNYNQLLAHYVKASDGWAIGLFSLSAVVATLFETIGWTSSGPLLLEYVLPGFDRYTTGGVLIDAALMLLGLVVRGQASGQVWVLLGLGFVLEWFVSYPLTHQINMVWDRSWGVSDRLAFFALASAAIVWLMQALRPAMKRGFGLSKEQVQISPNFHWTISVIAASFVTWFSFASPLSVAGLWQLAGCFGLLSLYGFVQGRVQVNWLYGAVIPLCVAVEIVLSRFLPNAVLHPWGAAIASVVAFGLASVPWVRMGWPAIDPIRNCAIALPGVVLFITAWVVNIPGLLLAGGFYAWLAIGVKRFSLSYISVFLGTWAAFRLLNFWGLTNALWYVSVIALAIVFAVEFDPGLKGDDNRPNRHLMRCLAVGSVGLTALVQSESSWNLGLLTIVLGLGFVGLGLVVRTRAYLYVGTLLFMFQVLRQLFVFIAQYSMLLWALGITLGLMLIWVAATFESRRASTIALLQYWSAELDRWE
jgi:hypothetical protein